MATINQYNVPFSRSSLSADGILTITLPISLIVTMPLYGVVIYDTSLGMPTQPIGIKIISTEPYVITVTIGDCPNGSHNLKLIYQK